MSLKRISKTLISLGFSQIDAQVYLLLASKGPNSEKKLAARLEIDKQKIHYSIDFLLNKHIILTSSENKDELFALPFEAVLDMLIEIKKERAKIVQDNKQELVESWKKMVEKNFENN